LERSVRAGERVAMHAGGLLRLREPSVAHRRMDLLPLQFCTLPAQIPGKDSDPQNQDE
jgi:hypothetical protein